MTSLRTTVRTTVLTVSLALALAASVAAAPQRGNHGGGHMGGRARMGGGGHVDGGSRSWGAGPRGPRGPVVLAPRGHVVGPRGHIFIGGGLFYDPFWGPYYPYGYGYPYPWAFGYPYWEYNNSADAGSVKTDITPKNTEVFVDGYFAGTADKFDGVFQRLNTAVGGHTITLHLDGYRTVTQDIYVQPGSTVKVKEAMERLAPGETTQPVQLPVLQTRPSEGATPVPDGEPATRQ